MLDNAMSHPRRLYTLLHRVQADKVYYHCGEHTLSYGQFCQQVEALGQTLRHYTAKQTSPVIATTVSHPQTLLHLIWACLSADICLAFLPPQDDATTLHALMAQVDAAIVVTDDDIEQGEPWLVSYKALEAIAVQDAQVEATTAVTVDTPAFIFQTSGTTGAPKWVMVTQAQCWQAIMAMQEAGCLTHAVEQRVYITPPFSHSYGLSSMLEYTAVAATLIMPAAPSSLGAVGPLLKTAVAEQVSAIEGVPYFYQQLVRFARRLKMPALRHIGFGGGRIEGQLLQQLHQLYPHLTYAIRYGMTETPSVISHKQFTMPVADQPLSAGKPLPIYDVRIVDEQRQAVDVGQQGEIEIRGHSLAWPYYGEPPNDDFFATGDIGYLNAQRELVVVGRKSLFLKVRGYRLSPVDIEAAIITFAGVAACRVSATSDEVMAEIVSDDKSFSEVALRQFLGDKLPSYAIPKAITLVAQIPRTASGKIKRH